MESIHFLNSPHYFRMYKNSKTDSVDKIMLNQTDVKKSEHENVYTRLENLTQFTKEQSSTLLYCK